jgi:hypothetical protein
MACGKQFLGGERLDPVLLWQEYTQGKQTYKQLALKHNCSTKTIQRKLDSVKIERRTTFSNVVNVLMDTTYFGRTFGVMVFKDSITGQILFKQFVRQETNLLYLKGIEEIVKRGINIPVQMCNFHQVAIIRRYLTKKPKMQASKELWELALLLVHTDKESFEGVLKEWFNKWESFLNERNIDEKGKKRFVHKKLRSAYRSLKINLPWLFTWYDNLDLKIPKTTNAIDGHFSDLKNKLRNHNGLSEARKKRFINEFFKA